MGEDFTSPHSPRARVVFCLGSEACCSRLQVPGLMLRARWLCRCPAHIGVSSVQGVFGPCWGGWGKFVSHSYRWQVFLPPLEGPVSLTPNSLTPIHCGIARCSIRLQSARCRLMAEQACGRPTHYGIARYSIRLQSARCRLMAARPVAEPSRTGRCSLTRLAPIH